MGECGWEAAGESEGKKIFRQVKVTIRQRNRMREWAELNYYLTKLPWFP